MTTETLLTCRDCQRALPTRHFYPSPGHSRTGFKTRCKICYRARYAKPGGHVRHPRYNARGDVWCNHCRRYLPPDRFKRHPSRTHTYWAYCRDCTRAMDRLRYRARVSTPEGRTEETGKNVARRRRRRLAERRERVDFVKNAIAALRTRGLTKAEICRLGGVSLGGLLAWERGDRCPDPPIAERFVVLLRETVQLPSSSAPAYRRRTPHPAMAELLARCVPQVAAIPVRTKWAPKPDGGDGR